MFGLALTLTVAAAVAAFNPRVRVLPGAAPRTDTAAPRTDTGPAAG